MKALKGIYPVFLAWFFLLLAWSPPRNALSPIHKKGRIEVIVASDQAGSRKDKADPKGDTRPSRSDT
ncbi:MAG: hypothetical protein DRH12_15870, partial [Deltaproteobacteria bacterium]